MARITSGCGPGLGRLQARQLSRVRPRRGPSPAFGGRPGRRQLQPAIQLRRLCGCRIRPHGRWVLLFISRVRTAVRHDGPNHLGLWLNGLLSDMMALITSGCG